MAKQSYLEWKRRKRKKELLEGEKYVESYSPPSFIGKVLMVFPGDYKVGMANLGFQHVMRMWLKEGFEVDRLFLDDGLDQDISFEKNFPIESFDIISISFPFEGGAHRLLPFLKYLKKLPSRPLVVLGGSTTYFNPYIFLDYVDYVIVGDGENTISSLVTHISSDSKLPPWIIRDVEDKPMVHKVLHIEEPAHSLIIPKDSVFENFFLIEIGRGCHVGCRFCVYGYTYRPIRHFSPDEIYNVIVRKQPKTTTVGLISASLSLHKQPEDVVESVIDAGYRPVPSSLHVNESTTRLISLLAKVGNRSMTFAVEHGDKEFQKKLGKEVNPIHLNDLLRAGIENGLKNIKLYFIMGLGEDPEYNAESGVRFLRTALKGIRELKVSVSFSVLVPKPWTPFESLSFPSKSFVKREIKLWRRLISENRLPVNLILPSYKEAFEEYVISRLSGDLVEKYIEGREDPKKLVNIANDKKVWKQLRQIDPTSLWNIEFQRFQNGYQPIGCVGDCSACVVKSLKERGDTLA